MVRESIFFPQWRDCLREQYRYVVHNRDAQTERTLTPVLLRVGFTEAELAQIRVEATMRADDMPDDFVPDKDILERGAVQVPVDVAPAAPKEDLPVPDADKPAAVAGIDMPVETAKDSGDEVDEPEIEEPPEDDDDAPQQLSLF